MRSLASHPASQECEAAAAHLESLPHSQAEGKGELCQNLPPGSRCPLLLCDRGTCPFSVVSMPELRALFWMSGEGQLQGGSVEQKDRSRRASRQGDGLGGAGCVEPRPVREGPPAGSAGAIRQGPWWPTQVRPQTSGITCKRTHLAGGLPAGQLAGIRFKGRGKRYLQGRKRFAQEQVTGDRPEGFAVARTSVESVHHDSQVAPTTRSVPPGWGGLRSSPLPSARCAASEPDVTGVPGEPRSSGASKVRATDTPPRDVGWHGGQAATASWCSGRATAVQRLQGSDWGQRQARDAAPSGPSPVLKLCTREVAQGCGPRPPDTGLGGGAGRGAAPCGGRRARGPQASGQWPLPSRVLGRAWVRPC